MFKQIVAGIAILVCAGIPFQAKAEIDDFDGYQGFVDVGYSFGTGAYGLNSVDVMTTHGIQVISTYLFTGVGTGIQYYHEIDKCGIPMYANVRSCFLSEENVSPFVDLKLGYLAVPGRKGDITDGGFFLNPTIGCTFVLKDFVALNAGIGYSFEQAKILQTDVRKNIGGFCIRIGIQF